MNQALGSWLASRHPDPHPRLVARMLDATSVEGGDGAALTDVTCNGAVLLLESVMHNPQSERGGQTALDLLAADALMTYSCEAACDEPEALELVVRQNIAAVVRLMNRSSEL